MTKLERKYVKKFNERLRNHKGVEYWDEMTLKFTHKNTKKSVSVDIFFYMDWDKKCWRWEIKNKAGKKIKSGTAVCSWNELLGRRLGRIFKSVKDSAKYYLSHDKLPVKPRFFVIGEN